MKGLVRVKKMMIGLLALLLAVSICAGALAEPGVHPYQAGAPEWAKEIADKGGPRSFATQVKEKYGEAKGEALLESLVPQKGPIEGVALPKSAMPIVELAQAFGVDIFGGGFDIGGTGIIGATISIIVASINQTYTDIVDALGNWYLVILNDDPSIDQAVYAGDKYVVTQTEPGKSASDPVTGTFVGIPHPQ